TWLLRLTTALAVLLVLVFGATNTVFRGSDKPGAGFSRFLHLLPSESGSSEVRSLLWTSSLSLVKEHPVLGCGPEVLIFCWYPHYPTELRKVELANAAPDRSHDEEIDILLTSGIIGELAYLAFLGITTTVLIRLVRRSTNLRSLTFAAALLAAFLGHIVEGLTGIAFSATLSTLWLIAAVATALYAGDPAGAAGSYAGAVVTDSGKESLPTDEGRVAADRTGKQSVATRGGQAKHQRELGPRARAAMQNQRRALDRAGQYAASAVLGRLKGGAMAILGLSAIVALAAIIFAGALFVSNLQIIQADASYRLAQNYEVAAGQVVNKSGQYQEALATYQAAISSYQDALNSVPTWIDPPPQDAYYLFLGKTLLEYADALRLNKNGTSTPQQVDGVLQQALNIFLQAQKANPLNPDHPRNIGKLYNYWATTVYKTPDVPKLVLGDTYFAKASSLAPHNSDILDEWGVLDMTIGNLDATQAHARYAQALDHLMKARNLYPESGAVYRDLGTAYAKYSQFATDQHQSAESLKYARLQEQAWLTALKYNAPQHEMLYPRLAELYRATFHDTCSAGQYAFFGLQNIRSGALADPDGSLAAALQNMLTAATTHGCHLVTQ
ncbi:MAG: Tetratricopeptide 2 repeat protein, partial [Chloroflexi bacterium]|nr:Tetratricopeptide 2 repeat protein [Chloroflexota bacterium]